jgi:hypothetical protein
MIQTFAFQGNPIFLMKTEQGRTGLDQSLSPYFGRLSASNPSHRFCAGDI